MSSVGERLLDNVDIRENVRLADYTTMKVGGVARYLSLVKDIHQLPRLISWAREHSIPFMMLGGGSNIVFSDNTFEGLVIKLQTNDLQILEATPEYTVVRADGGLIWDRFVEICVDNEWWGVENMSLVPGTVGAVAVQNVSAYGQEVKNVIVSVGVYDTLNDIFVNLENDTCRFRFRESIFNREEAGRYIIHSIVFRLQSRGVPCLNRTDVLGIVHRYINNYSASQNDNGCQFSISIKDVRDAIVAHRSSGKLLPFPDTFGNSGTFFRASVKSVAGLPWLMVRSLLRGKVMLAVKVFGCAIKYRSGGTFKLPSRLLIESSGLASYKRGGFHLYENNCAVVVSDMSNERLSADDLLYLVLHVRGVVYKNFGVIIPVEPLLVNFNIDLD